MFYQGVITAIFLVLTSTAMCVNTQSPIMINTTFGSFIGFSCNNSTCDYICFGPYCRDYTNPRFGVQQFLQCGLKCGWGIGAAGRNGCNGANCGYWDGYKNGTLGGFFDFRQCDGPFCTSGPFQGYFCQYRHCPVVCRRNICHAIEYYGKEHKCDTYCKTGPFTA
ncbi:hypothetical protein Aperf_G00000118941 [Anoplocephala perfoliata]